MLPTTDVVTKNSDGSYTSSGGYEITRGFDGRLYTGGAPIGLSDYGTGGVGLTHSPLPTFDPWGTPASATPRPGGGAVVYGGGSTRPVPQGEVIAFEALPVYLWMGALGVAAYVWVSGHGALPLRGAGLHLHPGFGVAAGLLVVWAYRLAMAAWPTALPLTLLSTGAIAFVAWVSTAGPRVEPVWNALAAQSARGQWSGVARTLSDRLAPTLTPWVLAAIGASLLFHALYWRHRRSEVRRFGWVFSRSPRRSLVDLAWLLGLAAALGGLLRWLR